MGSRTGCINSVNSGARLEVSGLACVSNDTLRFQLTGAAPGSFALLASADFPLPLAGVCAPLHSGVAPPIFDGLRCIGQNFRRNGTRATDAAGDVGFTNAGWGPPNGPPGGLIAFRQLVACQTRQWSCFYRDLGGPCGTGINTAQGIQTLIMP